jgi:hypothetical protein
LTSSVVVYITGALQNLCEDLRLDPSSQERTVFTGSASPSINRTFRCDANSSAVNSDPIQIDCGNGQIFNGNNRSLTATCTYNGYGNYNATCKAGNLTTPASSACSETISIGRTAANVCGDGIVDRDNVFNPEQCDLGLPDGQPIGNTLGRDRNGNAITSSSDQRGKVCRQCRIA